MNKPIRAAAAVFAVILILSSCDCGRSGSSLSGAPVSSEQAPASALGPAEGSTPDGSSANSGAGSAESGTVSSGAAASAVSSSALSSASGGNSPVSGSQSGTVSGGSPGGESSQPPAVSSPSDFGDKVSVVTDFGARGDGSTDDTSAIIRAVNAAAADSGIVYFPKGSYTVSSLSIPSSVIPAFEEGAVIKNSGTVSVSSREIYAGNYTVFGGSGGLTGFRNISRLNIRWFGATGNGSTDDSAAVQRAVNLLGQKSGVTHTGPRGYIYVPAGTYYLASSVTFDAPNRAGIPVSIIGDGAKKSVFRIKSGITGFYNSGAVSGVLTMDSIGLTGTDKTATGVNYIKCGRLDIINSYIAGLKTGCSYTYAGACHFYGNEAENNYIAYDIGEYSMFLYYEHLVSRNNDYFIFCDVPESGGVSNGIFITDCTSSGSRKGDVYVTRNQTVFIEDCTFTDGYGDQSVYFYSSCDLRVTDTVITSASGASGHSGIVFDSCIDSYAALNSITCGKYGIHLKGSVSHGRNAVYIKENILDCSSSDIYFSGSLQDIKVFRNTLKNSSQPVSGTGSVKSSMLICQNIFVNANKYDIASASKTDGIIGNNSFKNGVQ